MQERVEPPILLSRIMTFVFASAVVMVIVLIIILANLFPLNRPQVFFLRTTPSSNLKITLSEFNPVGDEALRILKMNFIGEYIKARNEIIPNASEMRKKWGTGDGGLVYAWSTPDVYKDFQQTDMWNAWMNIDPDEEWTCPVEFQKGAIVKRNENSYNVRFRYFCKNSDRQRLEKDYTIRIDVEYDKDQTTTWTNRLTNPLGLRVSKYVVASEDGRDPVDTVYTADAE